MEDKLSYTVTHGKEKKQVQVESDSNVRKLVKKICAAFQKDKDVTVHFLFNGEPEFLTDTDLDSKCDDYFNDSFDVSVKFENITINWEVTFGEESVTLPVSGRNVVEKKKDLERRCREHFEIEGLYDVD